MSKLGFLWLLTKKTLTGALIGVTISDRLVSFAPVHGNSMHPTFVSQKNGLLESFKGDILLIEKFCLGKYKFSHGDVITFRSPSNHNQICVKRLIGLPGEWITVPETQEILRIPEGHCWVEGDNSASSLDSRTFGPIALGLIQGRATHLIWPPQRMSVIERKVYDNRLLTY